MGIGLQESEQKEQERKIMERDAYSLYVYAIRSPVTKDTYLRRLRIFFNHIQLLSTNEPMEVRCNLFVDKSNSDCKWAFSKILEFLQFQKQRVENAEISPATLRNFVKVIKLFCEMTDIEISWKKIIRGLPKTRRYANDRAPTLEEIQKITEYPDRRIKALVYTMASSGIRLSAWDYLKWDHIKPIFRDGKVVAAKVIVYPGDIEEYFTFVTSEAYQELENWINYRKNAGEEISGKSWVMRWKWDNRNGHARGLITAPKKLETIGIKRLINDALWAQNVRHKSQLNGRRYEFQVDHGFRKWFKTRCEIGGMKSINIEILMGHSIGISDSYYRITEDELLESYLKIHNHLMIDNKNLLQNQLNEYELKHIEDKYPAEWRLREKDDEITILKKKDKTNEEAISSLSDQLFLITKRLSHLEDSRI